MLRDEGPRYTLNFGGFSDKLPYREQKDDLVTANPESGVLSRALHDHPIMRFASIAAATMVGMHVAGKVMNKGGVRLIDNMAQREAVHFSFPSKLAKDLQSFGRTWDAWEQTALRGHSSIFRGFHVAEHQNLIHPTGVAAYTWRQEMQSTLFRQARRLPYELPAAYATQRFLVDPLFGGPRSEDRPKWTNPIDTIADFGEQSVKNLFQFMLPFDAGTDAAKYGWRKLMSSAAPGAVDSGLQSTVAVSTKQLMQRVGHDFTSMAYQTMRKSQVNTGAAATALQESINNSVGLVQHLQKHRTANRSMMEALKSAAKDRPALYDLKIGPLGGLGSFYNTFRDQRKLLDAEITAREKVLGGGARGAVTARFRGGGTSRLERFAASVDSLSGGAGDTDNFRRGVFLRQNLEDDYKRFLEKELKTNLAGQGVTQGDIQKVLKRLKVNNIYKLGQPRSRTSFDLASRLDFGDDPIAALAGSRQEYESELTRRLGAVPGLHGKAINPIVENLHKSAIVADVHMRSNYTELTRRARKDFETFYTQGMLPHIKRTLGTAKLPYEIANAYQPEAEGFASVLHELSNKLNLNLHNTEQIKAKLTGMGVDVNNWQQMKALLIQHGVVSAPWEEKGYNVFGLRPLTVQSAQERGYFDHNHPRLQRQIGKISEDLERYDPIFGRLNRLRVGKGVWEDEWGHIIDLSPIQASVRKFLDISADRLQTPLVHIQPMMTLGYGARRNLREGGAFRYVGPYSHQPFLGGQADNKASFMWMGMSNKKGMVARLAESGADELQHLKGTFRASRGDAYSLPGRTIRAAASERGIIPEYERNRRQRFFDIDTYQPGSFWRLANRFRNRAEDLSNPSVFARKILSGAIKYEDGKLVSSFSKRQIAAGQRGLERELSRYGFSERSTRIFGHLFGEKGPWSDKDFNTLLSRGSNEEMLSYARHMLREDTLGASGTDLGRIRVAQRKLQSMIGRQHDEGNYFSGLAPRPLRRVGINTRIDEFKQELRRYALLRQTLLAEGASAPDMVSELMAALEQNKGHLTSSEVSEYRAAILSLQIEWFKVTSRDVAGSTEQSRLLDVVRRMGHPDNQRSRGLLENIASYDYRLGRGGVPMPGIVRKNLIGGFDLGQSRLRNTPLSRLRFSGVGIAEDPNPLTYNPFGGTAIVPTFSTAVSRAGLARASSVVAGLTSGSDPEAFSLSGAPMHHAFARLNRYFQLVGGGLNEAAYRGPLDFYARGLVGRRILPVVVGGTLLHAADATLGGHLRHKDSYGNRVYAPAFMGAAAHGLARVDAALSSIAPGHSYKQKRDQLLYGEVPVRKGRYWPLGNSPLRGERIQYFRPSWVQRISSGYKFTPQTYGSPLEKLAFDDDFSPLRPFDPYHWEKKHYQDRPYPVSGEYFTGPWGALTSVLNTTVGRVFKPQKVMHQRELANAMASMQPVGRNAMTAPRPPGPNETGRLYTKVRGRPSIVTPKLAGNILSEGIIGGDTLSNVIPISSKGHGRGRSSAIGLPAPEGAYVSGGTGRAVRGARQAQMQSVLMPQSANSGGSKLSKITIASINRYYKKHANGTRPQVDPLDAANMPILQSGQGMTPRIMAKSPPRSQLGAKIQAGQTGYEAQELFGIYGWGFGASRAALGFGRSDMSPRGPMLLSASRGYGTERQFWDLNLGGLGDTPLPFEGEYSNIEFSEITRRFIPHRRRDITEYNPLANSLGQRYPWLPGSDYFLNFQHGDPYSLIPEGEMRLPGPGYERFHQLHPDASGRYGMLDQLQILGDVAPYSNEYRALNTLMSRMPLTDEASAVVKQTRKQVSAQNKRQVFYPYKFTHQKFDTTDTRILSRVDGTADQYWTSSFRSPIRLAGVRARSVDAQAFMDKTLKPGTKVSVTYDANIDPLYGSSGAIDAIVKNGGKNYSDILLKSGYGNLSRTDTPLEAHMRTPLWKRPIKELGEYFAHRNTYLNAKLFPHRTAEEAWERRNVYGATFPQWHHPFKDFLEPLVYKGMSRNPIISMLGMGVVGSMFGTEPKSQKVGALIGAAFGLGASALSNANKYVVGERFIPLRRKQELGVEEYTDMLNYVKYSSLYGQARAAAQEREKTDPEVIAQQMENAPKGTEPIAAVGPITAKALQFRKQIHQTLYGADPFGDIMDTYTALPKRKRDFFMPFLNAPVSERPKILSTAGRLERRIYEARWGMDVEEKPSLEGYFTKHELPAEDWEGWSPDVNMDNIKLKIVQHMGLDASQMGYYPQQVQESNLLNARYPDFEQGSGNEMQVRAQLQRMLGDQADSNNVQIMRTGYPGTRVVFNAAVS